MRPSTSVVCLFIASLFLSACGTDPGFVEPVAVPTGFVRMVNAIPDSVALSPAVDKRVQTEPVNFSDNSSTFSILPTLARPFDVLYAEGEDAPKMMSVGMHCRLLGRPGRIKALQQFLDHYILNFLAPQLLFLHPYHVH